MSPRLTLCVLFRMSPRLTGPPSPMLLEEWIPSAAIMRHDPALAASPPVRSILTLERSGYSPSPFFRPLWTDNFLAEAAARRVRRYRRPRTSRVAACFCWREHSAASITSTRGPSARLVPRPASVDPTGRRLGATHRRRQTNQPAGWGGRRNVAPVRRPDQSGTRPWS